MNVSELSVAGKPLAVPWLIPRNASKVPKAGAGAGAGFSDNRAQAMPHCPTRDQALCAWGGSGTGQFGLCS